MSNKKVTSATTLHCKEIVTVTIKVAIIKLLVEHIYVFQTIPGLFLDLASIQQPRQRMIKGLSRRLSTNQQPILS